MSQKLVSVIIPTYNRADRLADAIKSVKAQKYGALQIIVADDGSEDDTVNVVAAFENVEYYYQANRGQGAARNLGLKHAKGEYIATLDSDDIWNEDFLEAAVNALEKYQANFVFLNWTEISENESLVSGWEQSNIWRRYSDDTDGEWALLKAEQVRRLFLETCPAPSSSLLIRRSSLISSWNEEMKIADDWFLILEMVLTKPCRAAFTLSRYWTKHIHRSNIYHGREQIKVIEDLGLHDEPLMARLFRKKLTFKEKSVMNKRLAGHYITHGRLSAKRDGLSLKHLRTIVTAFKVAPLGSVFFITQVSIYFLKNRLRILQNK